MIRDPLMVGPARLVYLRKYANTVTNHRFGNDSANLTEEVFPRFLGTVNEHLSDIAKSIIFA